MATEEVCQVRLSETARDALVAKLDAAATRLRADKPPKLVLRDGAGTWEIGCTLEGESDLLRDVLSCIYLDIDLP